MRHLWLGLFLVIGCATVTPKATKLDAAKDSFKDLLSLLGDTPDTKHTSSCLVNGCTYTLDDSINESISKDFDNFVKSAQANNVTSFNISIDSPGGSVENGYKMIHTLEKAQKAGIVSNCTVDTSAYSMAAALLQSCTHRYMTARASIMFHAIQIRSEARMSQQELENLAAMVKVDNEALAAQCSHRMSISKSEYLFKTDNKEWFLGADEAVKIGAVDQIVKF